MGRAFTVSAVAHALAIDPKWLDNLITHNEIAGIDRARQGISRQLAPETVAVIFVARSLMSTLGSSAALSLRAAHEVVRNGQMGIADGVRLTIDVAAVNDLLNQRLLDAVQAAPPKFRGRPRRRQYSNQLPDPGESSHGSKP